MKVTEINEDGIKFNDGSWVSHYHDQDCCENVYADWKQLEDTNIKDREFTDIVVKGVPNSGIVVNGYFVPCYNSQNGYYSSELTLNIKRGDADVESMDITDFVEYQID